MFEVISRTAELSKISKSKVVSDLVESCYEPMCRILALLEAATSAPVEVQQELKGVFESMEQELEGVTGITSREVNRLYDKADSVFDSETANPPPPNRGVRNYNSLKTKRKKTQPKKAKK